MFRLGDEFYGIPILKVNEIIGLMAITPIPKSPDFMKGIINLRGKIIPIMDLRLKFNMPSREYDEQTCIIIVEMFLHDVKHFIGIVVDKVAEVVNVLGSDIELPPQYGDDEQNAFLTGIGKVKEKVVMLLDIEAVINSQELVKMVQSGKNEQLGAV
jgi:purine-binding chemotaxis protein CheW